ncbi:MAG: right-handed parallel beta-helix repeat-containing protein [Planctomycetota bacterium]
MPFRFQRVLLIALVSFVACEAYSETVRISDTSTTSSDLSRVVAKTLQRLTHAPGDHHKVVIHGTFQPTSTIKFLWFSDKPLTVCGSVDTASHFDGSLMKDGDALLFIAGQNISIAGIQFHHSQGHALVVGGNSDNYSVTNCSFRDCRQSAIHVWNDPHAVVAETETRGFVTGNQIERFNLAKAKWKNDGITVFDQRVIIAGNSISNSETETNGIRAMGRDLVVERNSITNVSRDDSGGIYLWGGPHASLFRGNIVRWNHIVGASRGVYLDDGTSGATVLENVIERSTVCGIFVSGGRDNVVIRNVIDRAPIFFHLDSRCLGWDSRPEFQEMVRASNKRLSVALSDASSGPLLRERYPEFREISVNQLDQGHQSRPEGNRVKANFVRNVKSHFEWMDFAKDVKTDFQASNEIAEPETFGVSESLSTMSFHRRFGFEGFDKLSELRFQ